MFNLHVLPKKFTSKIKLCKTIYSLNAYYNEPILYVYSIRRNSCYNVNFYKMVDF